MRGKDWCAEVTTVAAAKDQTQIKVEAERFAGVVAADAVINR